MMSVPKKHAEWLNLIDINGPFLTIEVLMRAFPQGLDGLDTEPARMIRSAYLEWEDNLQQRRPDQSNHRPCGRKQAERRAFNTRQLPREMKSSLCLLMRLRWNLPPIPS